MLGSSAVDNEKYKQNWNFLKIKWLGWRALIQPLKISTTVAVASVLILHPGASHTFQQPIWALFTICFVMNEFSGSSFRTGMLRLQGTVFGAVYVSGKS